MIDGDRHTIRTVIRTVFVARHVALSLLRRWTVTDVELLYTDLVDAGMIERARGYNNGFGPPAFAHAQDRAE